MVYVSAPGGAKGSPVPAGGDAIDTLAALSSSNPARKRTNQPRVPPGKVASDPHWGLANDGPGSPLSPGAGVMHSASGAALGSSSAASAARVPRVSQPLRVEPPPEYNAPPRAPRLQRAGARHANEQVMASRLARRPLLGAPTAKARPDKMRDYALLASACQRAGRQTRAAHLIFNQGVLFENMGEDTSALRCYKELLRASLDAGDAVGEALACNCIGVAVQLKGTEASLTEAIKYHQQHLAVADVPGKFIAHCNLGLAYQGLGRLEEATTNHQHALRYAIRMSSLAGESLACGHLGMLGAADNETSKACTERQLQLAKALHDHRGQEDAFLQLGIHPEQPHAGFNLTAFALRMSAHRNGVSKRHGEVSRQMWQSLWPDGSESEVSVDHITNGVHVPTWIEPRMKRLGLTLLGSSPC